MRCLVTAGPTAEPLDEVRRLTNASTGRLATGLGEYLVGKGCQVTLLRSRLATVHSSIEFSGVCEFTTSEDLRACLAALAGEEVDAVFHVAAVSDFTFGRVYDRGAPGWLVERQDRKLDTSDRDLVVELRPTAKLIAGLAGWFPKAWRVGWKYELDGTRGEAIETASAQIRRYGTHACVVNGLAYGTGYGLVTGDRDCRHYEMPTTLYEGLWESAGRFRAG